MKGILEVDEARWGFEADELEGYYNNSIGSRIPKELWDCLNTLKANCAEAKAAAEAAMPAQEAAPAAETVAEKPAYTGKKRGRKPGSTNKKKAQPEVQPVKRGRGRPRKNPVQ